MTMASNRYDHSQGLNNRLERELEDILTAPPPLERRQQRLLSLNLSVAFFACLLVASTALLLPGAEETAAQEIPVPPSLLQRERAPAVPYDCLHLWEDSKAAASIGMGVTAPSRDPVRSKSSEGLSFFDAVAASYYRGMEQRQCMQALRVQWLLDGRGMPLR